jgi:hypothetical protein
VHKRLWVINVAAKDFDHARTFPCGPAQHRQRADNLKPDLPFVRLRQRADKYFLVWLHGLGALVGELLQQIERPHRHKPVGVGRERSQLPDLRWVLIHALTGTIRPRDGSPIAT